MWVFLIWFIFGERITYYFEDLCFWTSWQEHKIFNCFSSFTLIYILWKFWKFWSRAVCIVKLNFYRGLAALTACKWIGLWHYHFHLYLLWPYILYQGLTICAFLPDIYLSPPPLSLSHTHCVCMSLLTCQSV